jgi:hypothetical protein
LLLRSQLLEAQQEMDTLHKRLASAWEQIETLRRQLAETIVQNQRPSYRQTSPTSNRDFAATQVANEEDDPSEPQVLFV